MIAFLAAVNRMFDLLFWPFRTADPLYALAVFSVLTGILMVLVFRYTSDQRAIRRVKDRIQAHVLEVRLFQDQLGVVLRAYPRILRWTLSYLRHSLKPLAVLFLPLVLILVQLELRLGRLSPKPHAAFLLEVKLAEPAALDQVSLRLPEGLSLSAPPLRIPEQGEIDWRIQAERFGDFLVEVVTPEAAFTKQVTVANHLTRLSTARVRGSFLDEFLHPGEPALPANAPLKAIEVNYAPRRIGLGRFQMHWLIPFFVLSLASGFAIKGFLRTEI